MRGGDAVYSVEEARLFGKAGLLARALFELPIHN